MENLIIYQDPDLQNFRTAILTNPGLIKNIETYYEYYKQLEEKPEKHGYKLLYHWKLVQTIHSLLTLKFTKQIDSNIDPSSFQNVFKIFKQVEQTFDLVNEKALLPIPNELNMAISDLYFLLPFIGNVLSSKNSCCII